MSTSTNTITGSTTSSLAYPYDVSMAPSGRQQSKEVKDQLDTHVSNVKDILNNYDYEIFCMPNVIANTKTMSRNETKEYLKHIEALAVGYSSIFGNDLATLLLIGLTCKSRSVSSIARYYDNFSSDINRKAAYYDKLLGGDHLDMLEIMLR